MKKICICIAALFLGIIISVVCRVQNYNNDNNVKIQQAKPITKENHHSCFKYNERVPLKREHQEHLHKMCIKYGVPYEIALAVIETESSFNPKVISGNSHGYMQIHIVNKKNLKKAIGVTNILDPKQNMESGVYMLSKLHDSYGCWHKALVCYNHGEYGAHKSVFSKGVFKTKYSQKVMARYEKWKKVCNNIK